MEPFPLDALPDAFRPWAGDVADRMQCPLDFVAVPMLVGASMLVARRISIMAQARTDWRERANLWALIVGRPGAMKSPAMQQALAPLERMEVRAALAHTAEMEAFKVDVLAHKLRSDVGEKTAKGILSKNRDADVREHLSGDEPMAPTWPRYLVNDLTYEKLGALLSENPEGVLSVRDEMRGLFLHLAREESAPARAFYLQAWSGGRYTFDRIGRGTVTVEDARLSMIGCIQPGPLSELVQQARRGSSDDGMLDRFLIAWPDASGDWREVDRWPDTPAKRTAWGVFDRLDTLDATNIGAQIDTDAQGEARGLPFLRFAADAREAFSEWRHELEATLKGAENESLEAALSKFRHHVPALALVIHVIDGGSGPVTLRSTLRALMLAEYFESHARRLHGSGRRVMVRAARAILGKARSGALPDPFTARDVYRKDWAGLSDRQTVADALDVLAVHGWVWEATAETGGRKTTIYGLTDGARHG
ncbi:YfjI family protein [Methylibium sp.]|uniref:YfjI family protein n=1 Tax=Methylibium sp. TaxID=2067992 RepID=UPI0025D82274|nr:YfjI family protein [Methylibium sp.]